MQTMRFSSAVLAGLCLVWAFVCPTDVFATDELTQLPAAVQAARASVAWITYANSRRASGFVVDRGDGKKVIVTAGHVYLGSMVLSARLEGMPKPVPCELIDVNQDLDLMVVAPIEPITAPALKIPAPDDARLQLGNRVWLVGCPGGLELSFQDGFVNSKPVTAEELHLSRTGRKVSKDPGPQGSTLLIRHNAFSTEGMSGCPLIDNHGNVLGIQSGVLPDAKKECFAVSSRHLSSLNFRRSPRAFAEGPALRAPASLMPTPLQSVSLQSTPPVLVDFEGKKIDGQCLRVGDVRLDAKGIIDTYISEPDSFRTNFTLKRLQSLLDETPLVAYTNPVFGFRFLAPKNYTCKTTSSRGPDGILVTLADLDSAVPQPWNTLTIRAILATDYLQDAKTAWERQLAANGYPASIADSDFAKVASRRAWIQGHVLGRAHAFFVYTTLGIRARLMDGRVFGPDDAPIYQQRQALSGNPVATSWHRCNYVADEGPIVHAVHTGICENVVVIVHYQLQKQDLDDLNSGSAMTRYSRSHYVIRSSIALY
jgi:hypothetical protein